MDWLPVVLLIVLILYGVIAWIIRKRRIREDIITFYGPVMAIKTRRIGFFDRFRSISTVLRIYGSIGIAMVVVVSVLMTLLVLFSLRLEVAQPPPASGVFEPRNWFVIPGVNQFIPLTLPVLLAIAITIAIHEFGHGILCRVEGIVVKSMGVLLFVVPIGFFVEPDEEELERTPPVPKSRMFGAGIANNLVLGVACFGALILLLGAVTPVPGPDHLHAPGGFPRVQCERSPRIGDPGGERPEGGVHRGYLEDPERDEAGGPHQPHGASCGGGEGSPRHGPGACGDDLYLQPDLCPRPQLRVHGRELL